MRIISNHTNQNHLNSLVTLIQNADEVLMAVAFVKQSGLTKIVSALEKIIERKGKVALVAGQNFGLTEPKALYTLRELFQRTTNAKLFLAHAEKANEIFHPKLYMIRKQDKGFIISGSANLTESGLVSNFECSLQLEVSTVNSVWKDAVEYFNVLSSARVSQPATLMAIKRYETFYEQQRQFNSKTRSTPDRNEIQRELSYEGLLRHLVSFNTEYREQNQQAKIRNYQEARAVLDQIADTRNLTQTTFSPLLDRLVGEKGKSKLWHSGSLFRLRKDVYPYFKEFRELVLFIRSNQGKQISEIYDGAKTIVSRIKGAAANYIAEIMMTYDSASCANMNRNPITVLKEAGGIKLKSHSSLFKGSDYQEYCLIVKEIYQQLELQDMLEADSFFNEIYWKIYKNQKLADK